jgi:hypothetical protein
VNKRAKNNIALFIAFIYMVFACLYVVACSENRANRKIVSGAATISAINKLPNKTNGGFLSRPRVVRQRLVNELIVAVFNICLVAIVAGSFIKQTNFINNHSLVLHPPNIILLRKMRL